MSNGAFARSAAGYILVFPSDRPETIARYFEITKNEFPLDCLEFFCLTPLPGSEDHKVLQVLHQQDVWMEPDLNFYDLEHVTLKHPIIYKKNLATGLSSGLETIFHPRTCGNGNSTGCSKKTKREQGHVFSHMILRVYDQ